MKRIQSHALIAVVATAGLLFGSLAAEAAQDPQKPAGQELSAVENQTASGRLIAVDPDSSTLTIETADGSRMQFTYDDKTEVSGAEKDVAGLAPMAGASVTVTYTVNADTQKNDATRVQVTAQK